MCRAPVGAYSSGRSVRSGEQGGDLKLAGMSPMSTRCSSPRVPEHPRGLRHSARRDRAVRIRARRTGGLAAWRTPASPLDPISKFGTKAAIRQPAPPSGVGGLVVPRRPLRRSPRLASFGVRRPARPLLHLRLQPSMARLWLAGARGSSGHPPPDCPPGRRTVHGVNGTGNGVGSMIRRRLGADHVRAPLAGPLAGGPPCHRRWPRRSAGSSGRAGELAVEPVSWRSSR
jgi:hypothetical protein